MRASATTAAVRDRTAGRVAVLPAPPGGRLGRVRLPRSWRVLLPAAVGLPLLIMAGAAWLSWQQAWRAAETEMAHAADAAAEYARRLLDGQLLRIEFAEELLNGLSDAEIRVREPELHARLRRGVASGAVSDAEGPPSGLYVLVHDRNAFPLVSSQRSSVPRDRPYIDADFVAQMRAVPPGEVRISPVHPGRDTGRLFFSLARRRERTGNRLPEDEFDGFIVASAYVDAVADALRRLAPSGDDAIALVRADGAVLARSMGFEPGRPAPRLGPDHPALAAMRRGEARAARVGRSTADGRERIAAYRRVEGWPVYAAAGRDRAVVAARWRAGALPLLGLGLAATGLLAALTLLVRRKQEELAAANAGLEGRVAERTAALVASERRNREVLESLGDLLYALDRDGRVRFASRSLLKGWGIGEGRVLGRHLLELWPPLAGSLVWEAVRRGIEEREESHLCTVSPVLGRWIEMDVHPSGDGGVTVAVRDVHDLREAAMEHRRAEGELRDLLATIDLAAIMARDLDGTVRFWSAGCERLYGWAAAEAVGRSAHALLATRFPVPVAEVEAALLRTGEWRGDLRQRRRDGSEVVVSAHKSLRRDAAGHPVAVAESLTDVTALRRAEEQLRASEERLRLAQEVGGIGAWELDLRTGERHWSDSGYRMWGLEPGEPITRDLVLSLIVPEDRAEVQAAIEQADSQAGPLPVQEFRIARRSDGAVRWIRTRAEAIADERGHVVRHIGIMRDVTERRLAEERQALLMRELDHRAKNALAVVQAALRLTPKDDPEAYARAVEGRVAALARAHTMLARGRWEGAALRALVEGELAAFLLPADGRVGEAGAGAGAVVPRVEVEGPALTLAPDAAQALSMALHELATNATKYGALSAPAGRVTVSWAVDAAAGRLRMSWAERGGPPVAAAPTRRGFGSRVIEATVRDQLGGRVERRWEAAGLVCEIEVPLARVLAPLRGGAADRGSGPPLQSGKVAASPA